MFSKDAWALSLGESENRPPQKPPKTMAFYGFSRLFPMKIMNMIYKGWIMLDLTFEKYLS
jgi:hypothetical protein